MASAPGRLRRDWEGTVPAIEGDLMLAHISERTDQNLEQPRWDTKSGAEVETLYFVHLNAEPATGTQRERRLPEELTGFYYTG